MDKLKKIIPMAMTVGIGVILWYIHPPQNLDVQAWHLFAIFVSTILGFILHPYPMGAIAIMALVVLIITNTLQIDEALSGFSNITIWLIVIAFFISRGFIKTGLGPRISYLFVKKFGKRTLGLCYSLLISDLILAPAIPSNTARAGGVIFPIIQSLSSSYGSTPEQGTSRKMGAFLMITAFQGNLITSAMFLTGMAANPLIVQLAKDVAHIHISWLAWAVAALIPGLVSLIVIPIFLYFIYPPEIKKTTDAIKIAEEKLLQMGPLKTAEKLMLFVFFLVLILWIFGDKLSLDATTTAFIGLSVIILTQVLSWEDVKKEQAAWDTLIWFSVLVMMASYLNKLGMVTWFSDLAKEWVKGMQPIPALIVLSIIYYYSHYFFASSTAHISSMYSAFLAVLIAIGTPGILAALVLAFFSNLFGSTTHYGAGPSPVFFGAQYIPQSTWWRLGFFVSILHLLIWFFIGGAWWRILGIW